MTAYDLRISDWSSDVCSSDIYKGGTFPVQGAVIEQQYTPVTQESVLAYEIVLKTDLFDGRAHLNLAAFYYDYKDKQVIGRALFPPFGPQGVLVNVPKSRIFCIDTAVTVRPTREIGRASSRERVCQSV